MNPTARDIFRNFDHFFQTLYSVKFLWLKKKKIDARKIGAKK